MEIVFTKLKKPTMGTTEKLLTAVFLMIILDNCAGKYKQVDIEIRGKSEGDPTQIFTANELKEFDGSNPDKPVYLAVRGVVFDVSEGRGFYGKGSGYNKLAGKDASYAIAKWSLEDEDMHHDLSTLSDSELKGLDDVFQGTYMKKYPVVGYMDYLMAKHADKISDRLTGEL